MHVCWLCDSGFLIDVDGDLVTPGRLTCGKEEKCNGEDITMYIMRMTMMI